MEEVKSRRHIMTDEEVEEQIEQLKADPNLPPELAKYFKVTLNELVVYDE